VKILALEQEQPGAATEDFQRLAGAEAARAWKLYQAGLIRELYFRQDRPAAVLVLECADVEEAAATLATLPFVEAGLITFEIVPLAPYPGFARLFAGNDSRQETDEETPAT
jgi:muconolactone delta-isomerase